MLGTPGNAGNLHPKRASASLRSASNKHYLIPLGVCHEIGVAKRRLVVALEWPHLELLGDELAPLQVLECGRTYNSS